MMASIPNMRSTPLPVPTGKTAPAGDAASGGFAVPAPGQPCAVAPPIELIEAVVPQLVAPESGEDGTDGEGTAPVKTDKTPADEGQPETAVLIPFVQQLPVVPAPPPKPEGAPAATPAAIAAKPAAGSPGTARKAAPTPAKVDLPEEDTDTPDLKTAADAVVKALLQRKTPSTKQVVAQPAATDTAKADPAKTTAQPQQTQTPVAPVTAQVVAPPPVADGPQPALSPTTPPALAATEKAVAIDATSTADLATERKLDLSRDGAWLDRLARDIARSASDDTPLRFRLHPQTLGSLHVELQQGDRGTAVRLTVETEAARQILTDAQPRLTAEARAQGVRIAETHVDLSGSGRHAPGDQRRQDEARQTPFIRTAPGANEAASARSSSRTRADRYA